MTIMTSTPPTLPPLIELIELHDWETVQNGWDEIQNRFNNRADDGYGYIMITTAIKSFLMITSDNNGQQDGDDDESSSLLFVVTDILQRLFIQRRELMECNPIVKMFFQKQWKSNSNNNFHDRLLQFVCCGCPFDILTKVHIQVLEIILNDYNVYFGNNSNNGNDDNGSHNDDDEEDDNAAWVVSKMWTPIIRRRTMESTSPELTSSEGNHSSEQPQQICRFSIKTIFNELSSNMKNESSNNNNEMNDLWERTKLFIRHCCCKTPKNDMPLPLLHCSVIGGFPLLVVGLIAMMYPHQLSERDEKTGRIPLHYAYQVPMKVLLEEDGRIVEGSTNNNKNVVSLDGHDKFWGDIFAGNESSSNYGSINETHPYRRISSSTSLTYVQLLLHMYPKGAIYADKQGRLPLSLYLERATCCSTTSRTTIIRRRGSNSIDDYYRMKADIQRLIDAEPECLTTRDETTHLFPFMIPRSNSSSLATTTKDDDDDGYSVSLTFDILQMNPTSICLALSSNSNNNNQSLSSSTTTLESFHVQNLKKRMRSESTTQKRKIAKLEDKLVCANETISNQQKEINRLQALLLMNDGGRHIHTCSSCSKPS